ncbi:hypothetical protein AB0I77_50765 [Streptomyces sp. NPDC050619]|uniref:hypothetical protein n=1 Tax=Streptomyces sp. NPDC050619 TaxID=3157214 RepID=UPI0034205FE3
MRKPLIVDEAMVEATATKLDNAVHQTLVPQLQSLQNEVVSLLDSGLVLPASRQALEDSYMAFNKSVTEAVTNITQFAKQYRQVKDNFLKTDEQIRQSMPATK